MAAMRRLVLAAASIAVLASPAAAEPWAKAYRAGNADGLARLAVSTSAPAFRSLIASKSRATRLAALSAIHQTRDSWQLLGDLAAAAKRADRPTAVAAAVAARRIAEPMDLDVVRTNEISVDALIQDSARWRALARSRAAYPDVRVLAVEIATHIDRAHHPDDSAAALAFLGDPDAEMRRAALELLSAKTVESKLAMVARHIGDSDPNVAIAAAAVLCSGLAHGRTFESRRAVLGSDGIANLQRLARLPHLSPASLLDAARCLAKEGSPKSRAALRHLRRRGPRSIRRRLSRLPSR
jgi:hypothetical protein